MSFVVVGTGRSGTQFLAHQLDLAPGWRVRHEATGNWDKIKPWPKNYGEVNGRLRMVAHLIPVDRKALILRPLSEIALSSMNRAKSGGGSFRDGFLKLAGQLRWDLPAFGNLQRSGAMTIFFRQMVTDPDYLQSVARWLGIKVDVPFTMKKTNSSKALGARLSSGEMKLLKELAAPFMGRVKGLSV